MTLDRIAIGIDLGATIIKGVLLNTRGEKLGEFKEETHEHDMQRWKTGVLNAIDQLTAVAGRKPHAVGLSAPGLANPANTCIAFMPGRLQGLESFNWSELVGQRVWVLNDAHSALMAESAFGAAKGKRNVVMLTLGTGVGGAILIDGHLYLGQGQMAGHIGHMTVEATSELSDVTGMPGSIENAIGNVTVLQRSEGRFLDTGQLVKAVRTGDTFAAKVWDTSIRKLAATLASLVNLLSPELIVLGGGITNAGKDLFTPLEGYMEKFEWRPGGKKTPVVQSYFSDQAGAYGAAAFALSQTSDEM